MTPEQHLNTAENLLTAATSARVEQATPWIMNSLMAAIGHALIAHAIEMGVPHQANELGGGAPGAYPLDPQL